MKMRHLVVATSAALLSFGAIAGGGQQRSQSEDRAAPQAATEASIVREAQDKLRAQGYAATPQGLKEFQQAKGLEPSGKLDHQTLAALGVADPAASGGSAGSAPPPGERPKY
jgi:hypothetical protein